MEWPYLTAYTSERLRKIAMPIGGIGTGTISLGGRGNLRDWEIVNRPAKGFTPDSSFFALYTRKKDGSKAARILEGPIAPEDYEGAHGCPVPNHGLPHFRESEFRAAYPLAQVLLTDEDVPLRVRLKAFNPLVPGDPDRSGIPAFILHVELGNDGEEEVEASVCGCLQNFIGADGLKGSPSRNRNEYFEDAAEEKSVKGLLLSTEGTAADSERFGTMAIATDARDVTYSQDWRGWHIKHGWGERLKHFWEDFSADGRLENAGAWREDRPVASLCASITVPAGEVRTVTFVVSWHFPNRQSYDVLIKPKVEMDNTRCCGGGVCRCESPVRVGNYYATLYADARDAAVRTFGELPALEGSTVDFANVFCSSDLPPQVKEAALANLSTLRTQTCFRTEDGRFHGWEGCSDHEGCCQGTVTHVWNYELATPFLFGALAASVRETEFLYAVDSIGLLNHRMNLPLDRARDFGVAAADGQMGSIMRLYREWTLSGDDQWLRKLWPGARRALEFAWREGGWDEDQDGVMENCQHVTYDVEFHGPNPLTAFWYLGALRAAEEMAAYLGEASFSARCRGLFDRGSRWIDEHLFNGEYYRQLVRPFRQERLMNGLQTGEGAVNESDPELQLGDGCLVDQTVGQLMAHAYGLGYLAKPENIRSALRAVHRHNRKTGLRDHFNPMRSYALNEEAALLVCTYPGTERPEYPFPYFSEVFTGLEYAAAASMIYEGMAEEAYTVIADTRSRYDGRKRNPFNEAEAGSHYVRAMNSWGAVVAATGFRYSAVTRTLTLGAQSAAFNGFWSNGYAWGSYRLLPEQSSVSLRLAVYGGRLEIAKVELTGYGEYEPGGGAILGIGAEVDWSIPPSAGAEKR